MWGLGNFVGLGHVGDGGQGGSGEGTNRAKALVVVVNVGDVVVDHRYIRDVDVGYVDHVDAVEAAAIPGIEVVMRAAGQPADRTEAESAVMADAQEHHKRGRP